jgi:hypothetical protein
LTSRSLGGAVAAAAGDSGDTIAANNVDAVRTARRTSIWTTPHPFRAPPEPGTQLSLAIVALALSIGNEGPGCHHGAGPNPDVPDDGNAHCGFREVARLWLVTHDARDRDQIDPTPARSTVSVPAGA